MQWKVWAHRIGSAWGETDGTQVNTERRVQRLRQAVPPQGQAKPDWWIISELAKKILAAGNRKVVDAEYSSWDYQDANQIMEEIASLTVGIGQGQSARATMLSRPDLAHRHDAVPEPMPIDT